MIRHLMMIDNCLFNDVHVKANSLETINLTLSFGVSSRCAGVTK